MTAEETATATATARNNAKTAEDSRLNQCSEVKCDYDMSSKIREFLHKDTYILEHTNNIKKDDSNDRMKVFYSKFFQPYKVNKKKKIDNLENQYYFNTFGILPLELLPASYIPFNYKNFEMNLDRLSKGEIFYEEDYKKIFVDYDTVKKETTKDTIPNNYINDTDLKDYLTYCLKDKLSDPKAIFNAYNTQRMTGHVMVLWFFSIIMMLFVVYYYYRDIYSYILLGITILLVFVAIVWKMIYILNID
jgi:hypothetical protein